MATQTLLNASISGNVKLVKSLLAVPGINVNLQDKDGGTPLMRASSKGHIDVVKLLLVVRRIDINLSNAFDRTALIYAAKAGHAEIVKLLLTVRGIDVNFKDVNGGTALIFASIIGHAGVVQSLLAVPGTNVNLQDKDGWTALMFASHREHIDVVKLLLAAPGIDVKVQNKSGETALSLGSTNEIKKLIGIKQRAASTSTVTPPPTCADATRGCATVTTAASPAISPISSTATTTAAPTTAAAKSNHTWLGARLLQAGMHEPLALDCEQRLVYTEGFSSERDLAECPPSMFHHAYLTSVGITAMGVQVQLIRLQRELHAQYTQPSRSFHPSSATAGSSAEDDCSQDPIYVEK